MKTINAIKILAGKNIALVEPKTTPANYNRSLYAIANGHRLLITTQGEDVSTMRVAKVSDQDDPQSDYFGGSYWDTMPQVFRAMGLDAKPTLASVAPVCSDLSDGETRHTPGPWTVDFNPEENRFELRASDGAIGHFCGWSNDGVTTWNEDQANARLIAAAPALLAALEKCESFLAQAANDRDMKFVARENCGRTAKEARAAIASARGEKEAA